MSEHFLEALLIMSDVKPRYSDKYSLLISGCIRKWSQDWNTLIPQEITLVIHSFYPKADKWNKEAIGDQFNRLCLDDETQTITFKYDSWMSAFGTIQIRPKDFIPTNDNEDQETHDKIKIIHSWRVKVTLVDTNDALEVGVALCSKGFHVQRWFCNDKSGYSLSVAREQKYCPKHGISPIGARIKFESGDIVEMSLLFNNNDFKKCCLGYRHPGQEIEIAFDDLDINEYYCLGVAFYVHSNAVQIVE